MSDLYMSAFAEIWPGEEFVQQAAAQLRWYKKQGRL